MNKQPENIKVCNDKECDMRFSCNRFQPHIASVAKHIKHIEPANSMVQVCSYYLKVHKTKTLTQSKPGFAFNTK